MSRSRSYCFTAWADRLEVPLEECNWAIPGLKFAVFQLEKAPTTGRLHYQGYIFFEESNGYGMARVFRMLPQLQDGSATHLSAAIGTAVDNRRYCTKEESRVDGPWEFGDIPSVGRPAAKHTLDDAIAALQEAGYDLNVLARSQQVLFAKFHRQLEALAARRQVKPVVDFSSPRPWQQVIVDLVKSPADSRSVNWIVDLEGNQGKTYLAKHLVAEHNAFYCGGGRHADIIHAYNGEPVIVFDFVRDKEDQVPYGVIEALKNGLVFSAKYNSCTKTRVGEAHIIVFSNFEPDQTKLSRDRWRITRLVPRSTAPDATTLNLLGL